MKNRLLSLFMACCMLFGSMVFSPTAVAADTLVHKDHTGMCGAHLLSRTEITKKGDGSFDVTVDLYTYYAVLKQNTNLTSSTDDFYVVDRDGRYLVELWGGDGASVGAATGGLGGYVYGVMDLKVGDVLFYTLGGAGTVSAEPGKGGGANGGGGAGDRGSTAVGGGGGYSALFFYENGSEANRFYETYTDSDGHLTGSVSEADRVSKYIMIAGGGGGAGTGSTTSENTSHAHGGDGGYFGTTSGTLDAAEGYAVSGDFYAGVGGSSTDGSGEYAGKGGTYLPGKVVATAWSWGKGGQPNDWVGAQNKSLIGGAGGSGNYRGGGGGAGFAGGSGGVVSNVVMAHGVGGGGGGSSFVFRDNRLQTTLTADALDYAIGREREEQHASDADGALGGFFHIVYLDEENVDYLSNLNIEFARTPFFTITKLNVTNTVKTETGTVLYTNDADILNDDSIPNKQAAFDLTQDPVAPAAAEINRQVYFDNLPYNLSTNDYGEELQSDLRTLRVMILGVSLMPNYQTGEDRDHLTISLTFVPKPDFAGGNNVPLFAESEIKAFPTDNDARHVSGAVSMRCFCGYVNVPLNLNPAPVNLTPQGLNPEQMKHKVTSLFNDLYADVRDHCEDHWQYYFLEEIGLHTVADEYNVQIYDGSDPEMTVSPDETTRYFVSLTVRPKIPTKNLARFGAPVTTKTFTGVSLITIAGSGMEALGNNMVVYNKSLDYVDGEFLLRLHVNSDSSGSVQSESGHPTFAPIQYGGGVDENGQPIGDSLPITIPDNGTYTFTLKGGNGGKGGGAGFTLFGANGGAGGVGAYLSATFYLPRGTRLLFVAGNNAPDQSLNQQGALGGNPSYVAVLDENSNFAYYLMIAAGGPGGGGAGSLILDGGAASQPTEISESEDKLTNESDLSAYIGNAGGTGRLGARGEGGTVGNSYVYDPKGADGMKLEQTQNLGNPGNLLAVGTGSLTCDALENEDVTGDAAQLGKYVLETAISKYFTINRVTLDTVAGELFDGETEALSYQTPQRYIDKDTPTNEENYVYSLLRATIALAPVPLNEGSDVEHVEFTLTIHLSPRQGFLGGNDVKIIEPAMATTGLLTGMKLSLPNTEYYIGIDESRTLDYANVAIAPSLQIEEDDLTVQNRTYVYGDTLCMYDLVESVKLPDLSGYTWQDDYIQLIDPTSDGTLLTPSKSTLYDVVAGVGPLYTEPYAKKDVAAEPLTVTKEAWVYTDFAATFDLKHIVLNGVTPDGNGRYLIPFDSDGEEGFVATSDYVFTLRTEATGDDNHEHHLPKSITVKVGDTVLKAGEGYVYDRGYDTDANHQDHSTEAIVTIRKEYITGNVHVTAAACEEHHALYYVYQTAPDSSATQTLTLTRHYSEHIDPEIDFEAMDTPLPAPHEHYDFVWDYGELAAHEADGQTHYIMPKGDAWVTGSYVPNNYTVKVNYVYKNGTTAATSKSEIYAYGSEFNIVSPTVSGYVPDIPTVTGTVNGDTVITVTYTKAEGVTVYYRYKDGTTAAETVELTAEQIENGMTVTSPAIVGYTADALTVSVAAQNYGETFVVTYEPNHYTLTFVTEGGDVVETRTVEYDNTYSYSYDPLTQSGSHVPFPTAIKLGYTFEGWTRDGVKVNASDTVKITADTELVASFKSLSFSVTVHYVNDLGTTVHPSVSQSFAVGESYNVPSPTVVGHLDADDVSGTMPAQNLVFTVTYTRRSYTVTVHYVTPSGEQELESYRASLRHGDSYSVPSPSLNGYRPNMAMVEGVVNAAPVVITVTYYSIAISVDISWGDMLFSYDLGNWDPQTHTYSGGSFTPQDGSNTVSVTNNTVDKSIDVGFEFIVSSLYPELEGYYSSDAAGNDEITTKTLGTNKSTTAYFHLSDPQNSLGSLALPDTFVAGTCTLTISEAN